VSEEGPEAKDREAPLHHSRRLPALDELRAVAVLMVFAFHSYVLVENPLAPAPAWYGALFRSLWSGVDLFFVLSGFLISGILLDTREQPGMLKTFYLRRTLRIFPLYYATLLLWFVLLRPLWSPSGQFQAMEAAQGWFWSYSFNIRAALYGPIPSFFDHFWSLAVEEQFYLIWPLTILLLPKRALPWFLGFGVLLGPALRALPFFGLRP
jgi:peptidoglycan/LPS O-acetylase OafA/YrhL